MIKDTLSGVGKFHIVILSKASYYINIHILINNLLHVLKFWIKILFIDKYCMIHPISTVFWMTLEIVSLKKAHEDINNWNFHWNHHNFKRKQSIQPEWTLSYDDVSKIVKTLI